MDIKDFRQCDRILHYLYDHKHDNRIMIWHKVYGSLNIAREKANIYHDYLKAKGYIKHHTKGDGGVDGFSVILLDDGVKVVIEDSLEAQFNRRVNTPKPQSSIVNHTYYQSPITTIQDSNLRDLNIGNSTEAVHNVDEKKENWFRKYLTEIIISVVIAIVLTILGIKN